MSILWKVFKQIRIHIAKSPLCAKEYDLTLSEKASKESTRLKNLRYCKENKIKRSQQQRDNYHSKCEIRKQQMREYAIKNGKRLYEVQKMKRRGDI